MTKTTGIFFKSKICYTDYNYVHKSSNFC